MARGREKLTAKFVATIDKPGRYGDGGGLELQVSKWITKSWLFRYMRAGKTSWLGLGSYPDVTLANARKKAGSARLELIDGGDPLQARREQRTAAAIEAAKRVTFQEAAERYIETHKDGWKNAKHRDQWDSTLAAYVYPQIGAVPVGEVDTVLVNKVMMQHVPANRYAAAGPLWTSRPDTAKRVKNRIEMVLRFAKDGLPRHKINREHHSALEYTDLPAFAAELRGREFVSARALEFLTLTAARTGEVIGARWDEIDLEKKMWTVPAARMKAAREHVVPLSPRSVEILQSLPTREGIVFAKANGKGLSNMAMLELLRDMRPGFTVHGFRSSFRDWAGDMTNFDRETIEFALAHNISDKTEASYRHRTALEKRAKLMTAWADYCGGPPAAGKIIPMRAVASH